MNVPVVLIPRSLIIGLGELVTFVRTAGSGQHDDPEGDAARTLLDDDSDTWLRHVNRDFQEPVRVRVSVLQSPMSSRRRRLNPVDA
ncbi:MAG: cbb3-type cytochrome oxidase assembly protein CcoS [Boseongicola sp. SB0677_bin_26]|nr:cbb3-type cytochrome oxidase assembly protein CcoS [Boseongicola sp. SB0665_bin_10]MYG26293.1 cbb3-type cytochrome oxidase assembly protein CcoS [Boseongicola sp. SB0677_bin_26]